MIMSHLIAAHSNEAGIEHTTRGGLAARVVFTLFLAVAVMVLLVQADLALPAA
jgi:hypothetical protein